MDSLWHFLLADAKPAFWLAIYGGVFAWLGKLISDRASIKANAVVQKELEQLKNIYAMVTENFRADVGERQEILRTVSSAVSSGYAASQERRFSAIEALWQDILKIEEASAIHLFIYQIVVRSEFQGKYNERIWRLLPNTSLNEWTEKIKSLGNDTQNHRPFLGEDLWQIYYIYRAFIGRRVMLLIQAQENNYIPGWDQDYDDGKLGQDTATVRLVRLVFTQQEMDTIISTSRPFEPVNGFIKAMEDKMLMMINERLFGKQVIQASLEERQKVHQMLESKKEVASSQQQR